MKPNKSAPRPSLRTRCQQSFWRFCFSREQLWDWIVPALLCLVGYIVLRWAYPYPATYYDSFTYLRAAIDDQFSIFRPFGFSEWLRVIHAVSPSIHALFIVQTLLYALCTTLLILALKRCYPIRPAWLRWLISVLIVASPVAFYMLNAIMSDALFGCMVILMIAMLIVVFHEGSYIALLLYFVAFTVALFTRYSGMFFAVVLLPLLCFVPHKPCRWISLIGTVLVCVVFYQNICNHMYDTIRHRQFSTGFDGWQLANNAIHVIPFIDTDADEQPSDKDMRMLHDIICTHFRDYICQKTDSGTIACAAFMWDKQSPLKQYLFYHMQKTRTSYPVAWARLGDGLYADYGKWLIMHHPVEFCRYFLNRNIPHVFYPSNLEMVGKYTPVPADNREVPEWYGIAPADMTRTVHPIYEKGLCPLLPALDLFFWIVMIGALLAMLIRWKHWTMTRAQRLTFGMILLIGFVYCGSTAFASPITIRNWFPLQALKLALTTCCLYHILPPVLSSPLSRGVPASKVQWGALEGGGGVDILFRQDTDNIWLQWFRYCFVAVGAFAVDYGSYFLASYVIGIPYLIAAVIGFVLGTLTNYAISKFLVFRGEPKSRAGEIAMVFLIGGIGLIFLELGIWFFTEKVGVHYLVSKLIMTVIVFAWNFLARKFFMYSKRFNILKNRRP